MSQSKADIDLSSGNWINLVTLYADADTTAVAAGDVVGDLLYA